MEFCVYEEDPTGRNCLGKAVIESEDYAEEGFNGELALKAARRAHACLRAKVQVAGEDAPPGPPLEFTFGVERATKDAPYGLTLDGQEQATLSVLAVGAGAFADCNAMVRPDLQIRATDVITSVNGIGGSSTQMVELFAGVLQAECTVKRSVRLAVFADFGDGSAPLGLDVYEPQGTQLLVTGVQEGHLQKQLFPGDRIVSVGAFEGESQQLLDRLRGQSGRVQLGVVRLAEVHCR
uniref:PDZ domain-containing protein n=1 Tax=Alexandrium monilatum TaxID=311494 RepID=A0A7S4RH73_9DINO